MSIGIALGLHLAGRGGSVPFNYNLNPGIEVDATGYGQVGTSTRTRVTSEFNSGVASLRVQAASAGNGVFYNTGPGAASIQHTFSVWVKGTGSFILRIGNDDSDVDSGVKTATASWVKHSLSRTPDATPGDMYTNIIASGGAIDIYCDDWSLTRT